MKFCIVTAKVAFFLLLISILGCSEEAEDLTLKDKIPPTVAYVNISEGAEIEPPFEIVINFSEEINKYSLSGVKISGLSAEVEVVGSTVLIKIPEGAKPGRYTLVISEVDDLARNTMGMATTIGFLIPSPPPQKEEPKQPPRHEEPEQPGQKLIEFSIPIVDGTFVVPAGSFQSFKFEVTDDMLNPTIEGKFEVIELDANVFVFDEINFKNWKANVGGVKVWFQANRVAAGKINRQLILDIYYLVLDNTFALFAPKTIQIKLDLKYSKLI